MYKISNVLTAYVCIAALGYYRVNYDEETWRLIAHTLMQDHLAIDELNRAQIVNDIFALTVAGDMSVETAMDVLEYLNKEFSYTVWDSAVHGFELFKTEGVSMTKILYEEWQTFMRQKISTVYRRLMEVEQHPRTRLFRSRILEFACAVKHQPCLNDMRGMYNDYRERRIKLNPDFRQACYYVRLSEFDEAIDSSNLNNFELEDKLSAELKMQAENRFLYYIPAGTHRPLSYRRSTTSTTTEASGLVTSRQDTGSTNMKLASMLLIAIGLAVNIGRLAL